MNCICLTKSKLDQLVSPKTMHTTKSKNKCVFPLALTQLIGIYLFVCFFLYRSISPIRSWPTEKYANIWFSTSATVQFIKYPHQNPYNVWNEWLVDTRRCKYCHSHSLRIRSNDSQSTWLIDFFFFIRLISEHSHPSEKTEIQCCGR